MSPASIEQAILAGQHHLAGSRSCSIFSERFSHRRDLSKTRNSLGRIPASFDLSYFAEVNVRVVELSSMQGQPPPIKDTRPVRSISITPTCSRYRSKLDGSKIRERSLWYNSSNECAHHRQKYSKIYFHSEMFVHCSRDRSIAES
jgi:hypothetical protein